MLRRRRQRLLTAPAGSGLISRHPRETVALAIGVLGAVWIVINALWMQPGPHPSPIFSTRPMLAPMTASRAPAAPAPSAAPVLPVAAPSRHDQIGELIAPSRQVVLVQRALSDFGYGQIRPNGVVGPDTRAAIERFERKHKMPVTGQISDRLLSALSTMTGQTIR